MKFSYFLFLILLSSALIFAKDQPVTTHDLELNFDLEKHTLSALDKMTVKPNDTIIKFLLNREFDITKVVVNGKKAKFNVSDSFDYESFGAGFEGSDSSFFNRAKMIEVNINAKDMKSDLIDIDMYYSGELYDDVSSATFSRTNIADQTVGLIGDEGIYLSSAAIYYPWAGEGMSKFSLTATIPAEYYIVTDGAMAKNQIKGKNRIMRWESSTLSDGLYISGAEWDLLEDEYDGTKIYGFFFTEDSALSRQYVDAVKGYLEMYNGLFGNYAYPKFAVVENFFPTGYGMPSWTLLGQAVVRLPWIVSISLGHEVCHNWWGNGVFVDYKTGNWCEGLTTYSADYLYKEQQSTSAARIYRRTTNQDYTAYVNESNDFPLTDFRSREETYTRAIGYGKSMMVFHMLRMYVGDDNYWKSLQKFYADNLFKTATWNDIQNSFEAVSGENLDWFFGQWVDKSGAPKLKLLEPELEELEGQQVIKFRLSVLNGDYKLKIPLVIYYPDSQETVWNEYQPGVHDITLAVSATPTAIAVDPDFDVFRLLDRNEYPAALAEFFGAEKQFIVLPSNCSEEKFFVFRELADNINRTNEAKIIIDKDINQDDLGKSSFFLFGSKTENTAFKIFEDKGIEWGDLIDYSDEAGHFTLKGEQFSEDNVSCMITVRNPYNQNQSIAVFSASSIEEINKTGVKLIHYGKYSYLAFVDGKNKLKGNWEVRNNPLLYEF